MDRELDELKRLAYVEPPPELDVLVQERMQLAVLRGREEGVFASGLCSGAQGSGAARFGRARSGAVDHSAAVRAVAVPFAERCVYAAGLVLYGVQAASLVARVVWRALAG
jgi:hypothetical protein